MDNQLPGQAQQAQPPPVPPAPQAAPPTVAATAPPVAQAPQPSPQTAPTDDVETRARQYEEQLRRVQGTQAAEARRYAQQQREWQEREAQYAQQLQQLQGQLTKTQLAELPEEDRNRIQMQQLQQQLEQERQRNVELQWRQRLTDVATQYQANGVPLEVLQGAAQYARRPDEAETAIHLAAAEYWRQRALSANQTPPLQEQPMQQQTPQPQQQPAQQPVQQPAQQTMQQAYRPAPPPVTSHSQAAQPSAIEDDLSALADRTQKSKQNTVFEALRRLEQERK